MSWYAIHKTSAFLTSAFVEYFARTTGAFTVLDGIECFVFYSSPEELKEHLPDGVHTTIECTRGSGDSAVNFLNLSEGEKEMALTVEFNDRHLGNISGSRLITSAINDTHFLDFVKKRVMIHNPHNSGCEMEDLDPRFFNIVFYSYPDWVDICEEEQFDSISREVFGYRLDGGQDDGSLYSIDAVEANGIPYIVDDCERIVGAYFSDVNALFVPFDLPHSTNNLYDVMKALLECYMEGTKTHFTRKYSPDEMFEKMITAIIKTTIARLNEEITSLQKSRQRYLKEAINSEKSAIEKQKLLEFYQKDNVLLKEKINQQFEEIRKLPFVDRVYISSAKRFVVKTKPLVTNPQGLYCGSKNLGEIDIIFGDHNIYLRKSHTNKVETYRGLAHPHNEDTRGNVCWGNISSLIVEMLPQMEYLTLVNVVHDFLLNPNIDDTYGQRISEWPDATV